MHIINALYVHSKYLLSYQRMFYILGIFISNDFTNAHSVLNYICMYKILNRKFDMDVDPKNTDLGEVYFTPQNKVDAIISLQGSTLATVNQDYYTGVASTSTTSGNPHVPSSNLSKNHNSESTHTGVEYVNPPQDRDNGNDENKAKLQTRCKTQMRTRCKPKVEDEYDEDHYTLARNSGFFVGAENGAEENRNEEQAVSAPNRCMPDFCNKYMGIFVSLLVVCGMVGTIVFVLTFSQQTRYEWTQIKDKTVENQYLLRTESGYQCGSLSIRCYWEDLGTAKNECGKWSKCGMIKGSDKEPPALNGVPVFWAVDTTLNPTIEDQQGDIIWKLSKNTQPGTKTTPIPNDHSLTTENPSSVICPPAHPYAYLHGRYCCGYNLEKNNVKVEGESCDGGPISITSTCCKNDANIPCPTGVNCKNYNCTYGANTHFTVIFKNMGSYSIDVLFVNQRGEEITYRANLSPGESSTFETHFTHNWKFKRSGQSKSQDAPLFAYANGMKGNQFEGCKFGANTSKPININLANGCGDKPNHIETNGSKQKILGRVELQKGQSYQFCRSLCKKHYPNFQFYHKYDLYERCDCIKLSTEIPIKVKKHGKYVFGYATGCNL